MTAKRPPQQHQRTHAGFTLIELVMVIVIAGVLAAVALPRFIDVSREARVAALTGVAGTMRTTISLVKVQAKLAGLDPVASNPGSGQSRYIISSELGTSEIDFRNLCPESSAELGNALDMEDYMMLHLSGDMTIATTNQHTRIGFDITNNTSSGCYVVYDSFGFPDCTVTLVDADC